MHDPFPDAVCHRLRSFAQRSWLQLDSVLPYRLTARCPELAADRTHARRGAGDSRYAGGASRRARAIERDDAPGAGPQSRHRRHIRDGTATFTLEVGGLQIAANGTTMI